MGRTQLRSGYWPPTLDMKKTAGRTKGASLVPAHKVFWVADPHRESVPHMNQPTLPFDFQGMMGAGELEQHGVHLLMGEINEESCAIAIDWVLRENFSAKKRDHLTMMICSPGGEMSSCFALLDIMRGSSIPIHTLGIGQIASCGLLLFIAGEKKNRTLTPNTSILSHQFSWGSYGKEHELFATLKEFELTTKRMLEHYKRCTGLSEQNIRKYLLPPQDVWLSANDAKALGICDRVHTFDSFKKLDAAPKATRRR